jgi:hemerythrin
MSLTSLTPENIPSVAIDFMNQTHMEEVEIVNSLMKKVIARVSGEQNDTEISQQLKIWLEHTQAHFARENDLMQKTAFPAYLVHSGEHEKALKLMQTVIDDWHQNKNVEHLHNYVFSLWPDWFIAHVNSMDKVTAEYALMKGYPGV